MTSVSKLAGLEVAGVVLLVLAALAVLGPLSRLVEGRLGEDGHGHAGQLLGKLIRYGGAVFILGGAARWAGWDLTAVLATAGVVGVAVGFAAQTSLSNLIAGIFLLVDRAFEVGHVVQVDGVQGVVVQITLLTTRIRTFENLLVSLPNEAVLKARVTNYSAFPVRRVEVQLRVPHGLDLGHVVDVLKRSVSAAPEILVDPWPEVRLFDLADNGVTLLVRAWVPRDGFLAGRDAVVRRVHDAMGAAGLPTRVPQYEVRVAPEGRQPTEPAP